MMKKEPLISFCIATYKREVFLKNTINSIINQGYPSIEIIVSDNDSEGSARKVIESFHSNKVRYYKNKEDIGMVKNFNNALSHAKGDFITFVADDDPIERNMLSTLIPLYRKYPDADSFFGACNIYISDKKTGDLYGLKKGLTSLHSKIKKKNEINIYTPLTFLENFLNYRVISYFLWSTGFVRKNLVKEIGGMPDYNSPFLTDYVYICLVGSLGKMVVINKPLGRQTLHLNNFGREIKNLKSLPNAVIGFHKNLFPFVKKYHLNKPYETFINNWIIDHMVAIFTFSKKEGNSINTNTLIDIYSSLENKFYFFQKRRLELISKLYFPAIFIPYWKFVDKVNRKLVYLKNKY